MAKYNKKRDFSEGLAAVNRGFKEVQTDYMYDPREGYAYETVSEGRWGYINEEGKEVIPTIYSEAADFSEGIALVKLGKEEFFIDKTGKRLFDFHYETISGFSEGLARVRKDGKYGFINAKGEEIIPVAYSEALYFQDGLAAIKTDKLWGYINSNNEFVITPQFNDATVFFNGLSRVKQEGKFGCINAGGEKIFSCVYEEINLKNNGLVEVKENKRYAYFDNAGNRLSAFYDYSNQFYTGTYCIVGNGGIPRNALHEISGAKWGVINMKGVEVVPLNYDSFKEAATEMKKLPLN